MPSDINSLAGNMVHQLPGRPERPARPAECYVVGQHKRTTFPVPVRFRTDLTGPLGKCCSPDLRIGDSSGYVEGFWLPSQLSASRGARTSSGPAAHVLKAPPQFLIQNARGSPVSSLARGRSHTLLDAAGHRKSVAKSLSIDEPELYRRAHPSE